MITRFYLPLLSTNVKHPKFGCHVTSLCQGLRRSAGSGGEDPENQVVNNTSFGHFATQTAEVKLVSTIQLPSYTERPVPGIHASWRKIRMRTFLYKNGQIQIISETKRVTAKLSKNLLANFLALFESIKSHILGL